ncbi:hypothetical protein V2J09_000975 [Rumex salicifolius]
MEIESSSTTTEHYTRGGNAGGGERGAYLVWEDLTVVLPNKVGKGPTRRLLNGLRGFSQPGRIMAIMGPSGSGKSTLLDSLAGRLSSNVIMTGNILVNGRKQQLDYGGVAYVTQEDTLLGTLTVRETITYSAHLRFPPTQTKQEIEELVEGTILDMGLQDCADTVVGNWHLRGVSGGEKKRLSIALEILTRPQVLFLDEPTSGLDSAASFFVVQILRNIARAHRTVISSIHQPSSETFALFDDLFLLSGGESVYFGEAKKAIEFFAEAGFPCPSRRNPSDHFLRCINSDFDKVTATLEGSIGRGKMEKTLEPLMSMGTAEIKATLVDKYKWSDYARSVRARMQEISSMPESEVELEKGSQATWWKQLSTLTKRSFINMSRDVGYYWARIATYIVVSICVGSIYYDVGTSYSAILARGACGGFVSGFMIFMSIGGFPSFIEEMRVYYKERHNGYYGVAVYILSNFISSFPYLVVVALATGSISWYMVKFRNEFSHFVYYCLIIFGSISAVESCMMVIASVVPNYMMGLVIGAGNSDDDLRLLSFDLRSSQEFDPLVPGDPKLKGSVLIRTMFGIPMDHSKWVDLAALYLIVLSYRIIFFLVLKFKERAMPVFKTMYAKKVINQLKKRASFRNSGFASKRFQPSHPLHELEGLNSPIP